MFFIEGVSQPANVKSVLVGPDATQQALSFIAQARLLLTAFAYNSLLSQCGILLDLLSNTTAALKNGGVGYVTGSYEGEDALWRGKDVPIIGTFAQPAPAQGDALVWWQALAEMVIRLGHQKVSEAAADTDHPGTSTMVELIGVCGGAALPQRFITTKTQVTLDSEIGRVFPTIYRGAFGHVQRLRARETGTPAVAVSADETAGFAMATAVAAIYTAQQKKSQMYAGAVLGTVGVVGVGAGVVRKMRRR